jgi:hypothetical protein
MVPSSMINIAAEGEHLTCGGFSLGETVRLGNFEFIADYFSGLTLSPRRGDSGTTFMGSNCSGTPSPHWAMIDDSTEVFLTASSGEGGFGLPSPRRHSTGALPAPMAEGHPRYNHCTISGELPLASLLSQPHHG